MAGQSAPTVSSAEFVRRFGAWQDRANSDPVFVTHHGRRRHVMLSLPTYETLVASANVTGAPQGAEALRLETLVDQLDGGFVALDAGMHVMTVNPAACAYFGISRAQVQGRVAGTELPELDRSVVRAHLARTLASGEIATFDMPAIAHPGEWLRCSVFPYGDGVGCLFRNITGERASRLSIQSREALDAAIDAAGDIGCGKLSLRGTFMEVGSQLASLAGFTAQALEQVRLTDILPLGRRVEASGHVEAVLNGGAARGFDTALLVNKGGERKVRIALAPLRGDYAMDGAVVVISARD